MKPPPGRTLSVPYLTSPSQVGSCGAVLIVAVALDWWTPVGVCLFCAVIDGLGYWVMKARYLMGMVGEERRC